MLLVLPDTLRAHKPGSLDSPETADVSLGTMADRAQSIHGASPPRPREVCRISCAGLPTGLWTESGHPAAQHALRNHFFDALMRPKARRDSGQADLPRSRPNVIIDMNHAMAKLARTIDRSFSRGTVRRSLRGQTGLAAVADAQMAGLAIL